MPFSMFRGFANPYLPVTQPSNVQQPVPWKPGLAPAPEAKKWILVGSALPTDMAAWAWEVQRGYLIGSPLPVHSVRVRGHLLSYAMSGSGGRVLLG